MRNISLFHKFLLIAGDSSISLQEINRHTEPWEVTAAFHRIARRARGGYYLEGLAVAAALAELFDDALELHWAEAIAGLFRPALDLRHQERARVAQRPQRGLQARRLPLRAVAARRGCGAQWGDERSGIVGAGSPVEEPAAAEAEKAAPRSEEGRGGHGVRRVLLSRLGLRNG